MEVQNQIQVFSNEQFRTRGYLDANGVAQFNVEDVGRNLGIIQVKNGVEYVRIERINSYLQEFGFPHTVGKNDFIPESIVYRLAMKANNDIAKKFQDWIANVVVPSIMHTGSYTLPDGATPPLAKVQKTVKQNLPPYLTNATMLCVYAHAISDDTVKIGKTNDFRRRANEIRRESNSEIIDSYRTGYIPSIMAVEVEKMCHRVFDFYRTHGEYFKINFVDACTEIYSRTRAIIEMHRAIYGTKWPDANIEYDRFLAEILDPPSAKVINALSATPSLSLPLPPKERLEAFFKCAELTKSDEFRDEILRMIITMLNGQKF